MLHQDVVPVVYEDKPKERKGWSYVLAGWCEGAGEEEVGGRKQAKQQHANCSCCCFFGDRIVEHKGNRYSPSLSQPARIDSRGMQKDI